MTENPHSHLPKPEPYQRFGSGDGARKTLLTRQIVFEPLPASVLFGLNLALDDGEYAAIISITSDEAKPHLSHGILQRLQIQDHLSSK